MRNLKEISKITRLAKKFGTPLIEVGFYENGVDFRYKVGDTVSNYHYNDAERGIREEVGRLERLLAVDI